MYGKTGTCGYQGRRWRASDHSFFNDTLILSLRSSCSSSWFTLNKAKPFSQKGQSHNLTSENSCPPQPVFTRWHTVHQPPHQQEIDGCHLFRGDCVWALSVDSPLLWSISLQTAPTGLYVQNNVWEELSSERCDLMSLKLQLLSRNSQDCCIKIPIHLKFF